MREIFATWGSNDAKITQGHIAVLARRSSTSSLMGDLQNYLSENEKSIVQEKIKSIDLLTIPTNLLFPIIFYDHNRDILKNSNHVDSLKLKQQLNRLRQCSRELCTEQKIEKTPSQCESDLESIRASLSAKKEELDEVSGWYAEKEDIIRELLKDFKEKLKMYENKYTSASKKEHKKN